MFHCGDFCIYTFGCPANTDHLGLVMLVSEIRAVMIFACAASRDDFVREYNEKQIGDTDGAKITKSAYAARYESYGENLIIPAQDNYNLLIPFKFEFGKYLCKGSNDC